MLKPFGWPVVRSWKEVPEGLLQVGLLGAVAGPLIGFSFAWLLQDGWHPPRPDLATFAKWLLYAGRTGATYSLVNYSILRVAIDYLRDRYRPSGIMIWLVYFSGWIAVLVALAVLLPSDERFGLAIREAISDARAVRVLVAATILFTLIGSVRAKLERAKAQNAAAETRAQLKALQAQINPHFFFNTLNTIYALIAVDPVSAQRTVGLLADMSRHTFTQPDIIPLAQELEFANAYLEIEKIRHGARLQCEMPDASRVEGIQVPALSVQPLIENAIRHGVARLIEGGKVSVEVDRKGMQFSLTVKNGTVENGCETSADSSDSTFFREGHALYNIRERLRLHFGDRASLAVSFPRPKTVAVTITGPIS